MQKIQLENFFTKATYSWLQYHKAINNNMLRKIGSVISSNRLQISATYSIIKLFIPNIFCERAPHLWNALKIQFR